NDWTNYLTHSGIVDSTFLQSHFGLEIQANSDAITVVYISNANEENSIPMTPWIVAHRFAHSLTDNKKSLPPELSNVLDKIPDRFANLLPDIPQLGLQFTLGKLMTNRSARMGIMVEEYREEMIAQYLITGHVRLALPKNEVLAHG